VAGSILTGYHHIYGAGKSIADALCCILLNEEYCIVFLVLSRVLAVEGAEVRYKFEEGAVLGWKFVQNGGFELTVWVDASTYTDFVL
jgi:hypothetical protein